MTDVHYPHSNDGGHHQEESINCSIVLQEKGDCKNEVYLVILVYNINSRKRTNEMIYNSYSLITQAKVAKDLVLQCVTSRDYLVRGKKCGFMHLFLVFCMPLAKKIKRLGLQICTKVFIFNVLRSGFKS